jgi:putative Holliday junction resolvase
MKYLAIDYGAKRTGLAVCDANELVASPFSVLEGRPNLVERIAQVVEAEDIETVVVGWPLNMDGSEGPQAQKVRAFVERMRKRVGVPIVFQDERLSSFGAEEKLRETGLSKAKRRQRRDALAAAEILRAFLEARQGQ